MTSLTYLRPLAIAGLLAITPAYAGIPVWSFHPLTATTMTIASNDSTPTTIQYQVTNNSNKTHLLRLKPIPGIQASGCLAPLSGHQMCILSLTFAGSTLAGNVVGGPILCQQHSSNQCYQPSSANSLNIQLTSTTSYTLSGVVSGLLGTLVLANNGDTLLTTTTNGLFTFPTALPPQSSYSITVQTQPAGETCTVTNGTGTITNTNIANVAVQCTTTNITTYTNIYAQTDNFRVAYSFDHGSTWNRMINPQSSWFWNYFWGFLANNASINSTASMAIDTQGTMYQAVQGYDTGSFGQLIASQDGITWTVRDVTFPNGDLFDASNVAAIYNDTLYLGTVNGYVVSANKNSGTWTALNQGAILNNLGISALTTDSSGTVYAGAGAGAGTDAPGTVYYSTNQGSSWSSLGSPNSLAVTSLAVTTSNGQSVVYASDTGRNTYYAINNSGLWTPMTVNFPASDLGDSVTVLAAANNVLYAGSSNGYVFTLTPSGALNTWDATQQSALIDGTPIKVLTITQGTLSPLFVEATLGSNTDPQALPVNGGATRLTVTNYSQDIAVDVHIQNLPTGVTQIPGSDCAQVMPNGTCSIMLNATQPFVPQNAVIIGSNIRTPIEHVALVSSMNNYLVYNVNSAQHIAYVVNNVDASTSPAVWSQTYTPLGISEEDTSPCNSATDGYCNTGIILNQNYSLTYAAQLCAAQNNNSDFPGGTFAPDWWYLPASCELGMGLQGYSGNNNSNTIGVCNSVPTGVSSLYGLGYLANLNSGTAERWSSTERASTGGGSAWYQGFYPNGSSYPDINNKTTVLYQVRCVQGMTY